MGYFLSNCFQIGNHLCFLLSVVLLIVQCSLIGKSAGKIWDGKLVFQEDFKGDKLNSRWESVQSCEGKGHKDTNLECFTTREDNVRVRNGLLIIEAMPEDYLPKDLWAIPKNYTSGRVKMINDLGFQYGTFVVRARLANGSHLLSSIYLMPAYQDHDNCKYEEIDITQGRGQRTSTALVAAYFGRQWNRASVQRAEKVLGKNFAEDFHEFALVWKKYRLEWFVDGRLIHTVPMFYYSDWLLPDESNLPCNLNKKLFQQPLQFNFGLSVGGQMFPGKEFGSFTQEISRNWTKPNLEIDWVKVYQQN